MSASIPLNMQVSARAIAPRIWAVWSLLSVGCGGYVGSTTPSGDVREDASSATADDDAGADSGSGPDSKDGGSARDAAAQDAAVRDAAARDASIRDGAVPDAAMPDAGTSGAMGRSAGCGMASAGGDGMFAEQTARIGGVDRSYQVRLPDQYDATRAYPLIFRFHGYGGDGLSGGLGIEGPAGADAIIVAPDGLNQGWSSSSETSDLALFDAMYQAVTQRYCVDLGRVFSYGFSMGGGFTNLLGCRRAEQLRATAAIAGFDRGTGTCARPVAAWFQHDRGDDAVEFSQGTSARDRVLARAHCSMNTEPAGTCVRYQGCDPGYPVVWCETSGRGHNIAGDTAPAAVWDFFRTLP